MCALGFKEQIYDVYRYLPPATQVCLISATLPHEILEMTNKFMTDPIRILVKRWVNLPGNSLDRLWLRHVVIGSSAVCKGVSHEGFPEELQDLKHNPTDRHSS